MNHVRSTRHPSLTRTRPRNRHRFESRESDGGRLADHRPVAPTDSPVVSDERPPDGRPAQRSPDPRRTVAAPEKSTSIRSRETRPIARRHAAPSGPRPAGRDAPGVTPATGAPEGAAPAEQSPGKSFPRTPGRDPPPPPRRPVSPGFPAPPPTRPEVSDWQGFCLGRTTRKKKDSPF